MKKPQRKNGGLFVMVVQVLSESNNIQVFIYELKITECFDLKSTINYKVKLYKYIR